MHLTASFSLLKLVQTLFVPCVSSFDSLATFVVYFFCAFVCLTFLAFVYKMLLILLNAKGCFCFATVFHWYLLIRHSVCHNVPHHRSFCPFIHDSRHCFHLTFLFPLSLLKFFQFLTYMTQYFVKYIKRSSDTLQAPLCFPKNS